MSVHISRFEVLKAASVLASVGSLVWGSAAGAPASTVGQADSFLPLTGGSSNVIAIWGGYVATAAPGTFTTASASWTIPRVTCLKDRDYYAPWVGIDGDGSPTVEQ